MDSTPPLATRLYFDVSFVVYWSTSDLSIEIYVVLWCSLLSSSLRVGETKA